MAPLKPVKKSPIKSNSLFLIPRKRLLPRLPADQLHPLNLDSCPILTIRIAEVNANHRPLIYRKSRIDSTSRKSLRNVRVNYMTEVALERIIMSIITTVEVYYTI